MRVKTRIIWIATAVIAGGILAGCQTETMESITPKKQEIVFACSRDNTGTLETVMQEFSGQSETTQVKLLEFSRQSVDCHRVISSALSGGEFAMDVMLTEDVWVPEFIKSGYLKPLDDWVELQNEEYLPAVDAFARERQMLYWVPIFMDAGVMYYRKDLTDGTKNYQQLVEEGSSSYGIQGADGEEMLCNVLELMNLTGSIREGLQLYKRALESTEKKGENYLTDFKDGRVEYVRAWAGESRELINGFSSVRGKVGTRALVGSNGKTYAVARMYGIAVNAAGGYDESVKELLQYLQQEDVQKRILKGTGMLPVQAAYYTDPLVLDYTEYHEDFKSLLDSLTFRPRRNDYTHASREAQKVLAAYLEGTGTLEEAEAELTRLLDTTAK